MDSKIQELKLLLCPKLLDIDERLISLNSRTHESLNEINYNIDQTQRLRKHDKSDHLVEFNNINKKIQN